MIYLVAIFCAPLALLLIGKPFQALANLILYILSIAFWLTIIFHSIGLALWAIGLLHAVLAINNHKADKRLRHLLAEMRARRSDPA
ncbi:MAG: hypothetical protein KGJ53_13715 [Alphaproteobacteria bacterium]|nr:hypothetical protein [Alphaproteobacteria bacterium]MDE1986991.1 hypothetical protein [Alphaproteobacteria bacterium]MDE2164216.1 hypothetical protein [Alphaproteobacteria bacterium]